MSEQNKTHYRRVFKSDHLGVADLEDLIESGHDLVFKIAQVKQEWGVKVAGKKIDADIAYFECGTKPWVINRGNGAICRKLSGGSPYVEDWAGLTVQLYIDPTAKMKGETVGGVRISPNRVIVNDKIPKLISKAKTKEALQAIWAGECGSNPMYSQAITDRLNEITKDASND